MSSIVSVKILSSSPSRFIWQPMKVFSCLMKKMSTVTDEVTFQEVQNKGIITLNRPKALNALNLSMVRQIYPKLKKWQSGVRAVIIKGSGEKAFCAGGDIRAVTTSGKSEGPFKANQFFREEYQLNHLIGTLQVPYIALIHGITMGGGVGLSVHGRYRIATEKTVFAMPETAIGLFPDVGGTYFLSRLEGELGSFLALTGFRLTGSDVYKAGIATHFCASNELNMLEDELIKLEDVSKITQVLDKYTQKNDDLINKEFVLKSVQTKINALFNANSMESILNNLEKDGSEWALKQRDILTKMSPISLKVTLKALREGAKLSFEDCFKMELRLGTKFLAGKDFYEGVRSVLVDRDNKPIWNPSTIAEVTEDDVNNYFLPLNKDQELQLETQRSTL